MTASVAVQLFAARVLEGATVLQALAQARRNAAPPDRLSELLARLSRWRQTYDLTHVQMARLCRVSLPTYQKWEAGIHRPQYRARQRIVQVITRPPPKAYRTPTLTLRHRIRDTLTGLPDGQAHCQDLAMRLGETLAHVRMACHHMAHDGRLLWVRPGVYALPGRNS